MRTLPSSPLANISFTKRHGDAEKFSFLCVSAYLRENYAFSTCAKSSSTGVERPKIVTDTRSLLFS